MPVNATVLTQILYLLLTELQIRTPKSSSVLHPEFSELLKLRYIDK